VSGILRITSKHKPRALVSLVRKRGDTSFGSNLDLDDEKIRAMIPDVSPHGFVVSRGSAIMLAGLVNVRPHTDTAVGDLKTKHGLFGLLSGGKNAELLVRRIGDSEWDVTKLTPGDWVVFRDDLEHLVMAETKWLGVAVQLAPIDATAGA